MGLGYRTPSFIVDAYGSAQVGVFFIELEQGVEPVVLIVIDSIGREKFPRKATPPSWIFAVRFRHVFALGARKTLVHRPSDEPPGCRRLVFAGMGSQMFVIVDNVAMFNLSHVVNESRYAKPVVFRFRQRPGFQVPGAYDRFRSDVQAPIMPYEPFLGELMIENVAVSRNFAQKPSVVAPGHSFNGHPFGDDVFFPAVRGNPLFELSGSEYCSGRFAKNGEHRRKRKRIPRVEIFFNELFLYVNSK